MTMRRRKELEQRVAELEEALERVSNVSDCALDCEHEPDDNGDDDE